jgi:hypothetical protein
MVMYHSIGGGEMRTLSKYLIFFTGTLFLSSFMLASFAIAQEEPCQPLSCKVTAKRDVFDIAIIPDDEGLFPIEVSGEDYCGSNPEDSPCLLWQYECLGADCNNIGKIWVQIPICCKNPIEILKVQNTADPLSLLSYCYDDNNPGKTCNSAGLRVTPVSGGEGPLTWFTTKKDVEYNVIDIFAQVGSEYLTCVNAIAGPGCKDKIPEVRVEPRVQCYQFTADNDNCQRAQTWYAQWAGTNPCAVDVWVADGIVPCSDFPEGFTNLTGEELGDITINVNGTDQILTEAITNNSQCDEGWLRFVDPGTGCNKRCYYTGGTKYCY